MMTSRYVWWLLLRYAERQAPGSMNQLPPRRTRPEDARPAATDVTTGSGRVASGFE